MPNAIGQPIPRTEDQTLVTGGGRFTDDINVEGQAYAVVVRSQYPHATIERIDASQALRADGVLAVLTASDLGAKAGSAVVVSNHAGRVLGREDSVYPHAHLPPLAVDKVRYLGEPVAFVVAQSLLAACDAAELVEIEYEPMAPVMDFSQALDERAEAVFDDIGGNVSFEWENGDCAAVDAALEEAAHVARLQLVNNRVVVAFMEPRCALADYDSRDESMILYAGSQTAHGLRTSLSELLEIEPSALRVVSPDTGGGFGARGLAYPEFALCLFAARRLRRPVKWTAERGESFLSDTQSRDSFLVGELGLDADGSMTGLRVTMDWRHGGYLLRNSVNTIINFFPPTLGGVYKLPAVHTRIRGLFSNTTPLGAYRGIGRVEATYLIESLVDEAAKVSGRDRIELRRRNTMRSDELPLRAGGGALYDAGDFVHNLDEALRLADWPGFEARRGGARARGRLRGIGLAAYVENDGGAPCEYARIEVGAERKLKAIVGTQDFGMGHGTTYAQVLSDVLGVPFECIEVIEGDTDLVARGSGSHGSRSMRIGGTATVLGARALIARGMARASELLEASPDDIEYVGGGFVIKGTDRRVSLFEVALAMAADGESLYGEADFTVTGESHSNGCHVCELEVDADTGAIRILDYVAVTDAGRIVNPMLATGQLHGGVAQGVGQALLEAVVYDLGSGQTLTGSLMDYALPRADDLPNFVTAFHELHERDNELGVKGVGEGGTTGAVAATMNALRDALAGAGCSCPDMPATPERVWRAVRDHFSARP
ncbi:MAG: xanthine dehydrogenase family protein molybdopterin-binding subunit [Gammaproteobacteria bacterium]